MRCFYDPGYYLPLPPDHPFPMDKFPRAAAMLRETWPDIRLEPARPAAMEDLLRVHTRDYLDSIKDGTLAPRARQRLGLPHHPRLLHRSRLETGGTLQAARAALADGIAANLAGGTHHAFPAAGLGYCVLNDVAVAACALHSYDPGLRLAIVDTDAHQGNGTHAIFAEDSRVATYSIHVGRNYPAKKEPGDCDVPLPRYTGPDEYLAALDATLPSFLHSVEPDLVFWISGADVHEADRFGQLRLDTPSIHERDLRVCRACREVAAPLVVLYGGGYNRDRVHTARLHAQSVLVAAEVSGKTGGRVTTGSPETPNPS